MTVELPLDEICHEIHHTCLEWCVLLVSAMWSVLMSSLIRLLRVTVFFLC